MSIFSDIISVADKTWFISKSRVPLLILCLCCLFSTFTVQSATAEEPVSDGWQFSTNAYFWAPSVGMTTASGTDVDVSFSDILDALKFTFMGVFEARKGKWSFLADVIYLNLEEDNISVGGSVPIGPFQRSSLSVNVEADVELTSWVLTPAIGYRVIQKEKVKIDVLGGARYLYLKADTKLDLTAELNIELINQGFSGIQQVNARIVESAHVWDGIVGIRGHVNLNEKWFLTLYADVGAGDSDLTWQAVGGVGYKFDKVDVILGYRHLAWEFGGNVIDDMNISGPFLGGKFSF